MTQMASSQQHVAIDFYEENKDFAEHELLHDLKFRIEKEGYVLDSEPIIKIAGYIKVTESGFIPVEDKESADLVEMFAFAEVIKKEL